MIDKKYFNEFDLVAQKKYEALRAYYVDNLSCKDAARKFGYTLSSYHSLIRDFKKHLKEKPNDDYFFKNKLKGRKDHANKDFINSTIINLRKRNFSISDIKTVLDAQENSVSESFIYAVLKSDGFDRLPRRSIVEKQNLQTTKIEAPKSHQSTFSKEEFNSNSAGILMLLHYIKSAQIDKAIKEVDFPESKTINKLQSILCFLALKFSNIRRYSADDLWCMDKGLGLFAGLNVLPKTALLILK